MTHRILISIFILTLFVSCSTTGKVTNDTVSKHLIFGNGGGFTGIYTSYKIQEDGSVFALLPDSTFKPVKKLKKKEARSLFEQADKIKITQPVFNHPGNMTWFIKYRVNGAETVYIWGDSNVSVPTEIKDLYNKLNTIIK